MRENLKLNVNTIAQGKRLAELGVVTGFKSQVAYWSIHFPKVAGRHPVLTTLYPIERWPNYSSYDRDQRQEFPALTLSEIFIALGADKFGILPAEVDLNFDHHLKGHTAENMVQYYAEILILLITANKITPEMVVARLEAYYEN